MFVLIVIDEIFREFDEIESTTSHSTGNKSRTEDRENNEIIPYNLPVTHWSDALKLGVCGQDRNSSKHWAT